jgi:hypothetical protein
MGDRFVREWCRKFRDGRIDVGGECGQVRHSIDSNVLVHKVVRKFCRQNLWHQGPQ